MDEDPHFDRKTQVTIAARLKDILAGNVPTTTQAQYISAGEEAPTMENNTSSSENEGKGKAHEIHSCRATEQNFRGSLHRENMKSEVKEWNTKHLPDLVTIEVTQGVEDKKVDVKEVIDVVLRSPTPMSQIASFMPEKEEIIGTFSKFSEHRVEEAVDDYMDKLAEKDRVTVENHRSTTVDPRSHSRTHLKSRY